MEGGSGQAGERDWGQAQDLLRKNRTTEGKLEFRSASARLGWKSKTGRETCRETWEGKKIRHVRLLTLLKNQEEKDM